MTNTPENTPTENTYNAPIVHDPETGHEEVLGMGRVAVMGEQGVARVVSYPQDNDDMLDTLVADGRLTYNI